MASRTPCSNSSSRHGPVELSVICIAGASGVALGESIIRPPAGPRRDSFQACAHRVGPLLLLCAALLVGCGFIEGFVSPDPRFPMASRITIGVGYWVMMWSLLTGRLRIPISLSAAGAAEIRVRGEHRVFQPFRPGHQSAGAQGIQRAHFALQADAIFLGRQGPIGIQPMPAGACAIDSASALDSPATKGRCLGNKQSRGLRQLARRRRVIHVGQHHDEAAMTDQRSHPGRGI